MSDGMTDGYRMEREARDADEREGLLTDFDTSFRRKADILLDLLHSYRAKRTEFLHTSDYDEKIYTGRRERLRGELTAIKPRLIAQLEVLAGLLEKKL